MKNAHIVKLEAIETLKKEQSAVISGLFYDYVITKYFEGFDLTIAECAVLLKFKEMTVRAYANPAKNILQAIKHDNKTHISNVSIELFLSHQL